MRSREDAAELARICALNARAANSEQVASELWREWCQWNIRPKRQS